MALAKGTNKKPFNKVSYMVVLALCENQEYEKNQWLPVIGIVKASRAKYGQNSTITFLSKRGKKICNVVPGNLNRFFVNEIKVLAV